MAGKERPCLLSKKIKGKEKRVHAKRKKKEKTTLWHASGGGRRSGFASEKTS